nr:L-type lectin-domain containing receptor kinase IV.1-like [Ipomoea batatas]
MIFKLVILWIVISSALLDFVGSEDVGFTYHGFNSANLSLDGAAGVMPNGILMLTNETTFQTSRALYSVPVNFKGASNGSSFSFSTTFVFAIVPGHSSLDGHGMTFAISPVGGLPGGLDAPYLGLFNGSNNGKSTNHVVAVELDTMQTKEFRDIDGNHVGIDINGMISNVSKSAGYFDDTDNTFRSLRLAGSKAIKVWVEYDGKAKQMDVTMAPLMVSKPKKPILSFSYDLSMVFQETMSVGFTAATGAVVSTQYVLGWSFKMNGVALELDPYKLPKLPRIGPKERPKVLVIGVPMVSTVLFVVIFLGVVYYIGRKRKFAELLEDWELEFGPHRFKYKDLYYATKGFSDKELLGTGGFGMVYRGVLECSKMEIAVKRVSHGSRQGMREFVAEIVSIGRLRHRNLVPLLGYCRRKGYLAPEQTRAGKATTCTDVYAFGAFLLEVVCGRRPLDPQVEDDNEAVLVDRVFSYWCRGEILKTVDSNLGADYVVGEVELVLKLGLLCCQYEPMGRPSMRQAVLYLQGALPLPELSLLRISSAGIRGVAVEDSSSPNGVRLLIQEYPYAVDGLEIWSSIKTWVQDYCKIYYKSDNVVQKDTELQAWWKELREQGHGDLKDKPWWPKMQTVQELIDSCTIIIWIASINHLKQNTWVGECRCHRLVAGREARRPAATVDGEQSRLGGEARRPAARRASLPSVRFLPASICERRQQAAQTFRPRQQLVRSSFLELLRRSEAAVEQPPSLVPRHPASVFEWKTSARANTGGTQIWWTTSFSRVWILGYQEVNATFAMFVLCLDFKRSNSPIIETFEIRIQLLASDDELAKS